MNIDHMASEADHNSVDGLLTLPKPTRPMLAFVKRGDQVVFAPQ